MIIILREENGMKKIILYGTETCPHCVEAKRFLTERDIDFVYKDVNNDDEDREEFMAKEYAGVPVIIIDDQEILGFSRLKLEELLSE